MSDPKVDFHRWWLDHGSFLTPAITEEQAKGVYTHFSKRISELELELEEESEKMVDVEEELSIAKATINNVKEALETALAELTDD